MRGAGVQQRQARAHQGVAQAGEPTRLRGRQALDVAPQRLDEEHLGQPREQMTERVVRALRNPYVDIFAHPTGRLIGEREPYEIDMDRVIAALNAVESV